MNLFMRANEPLYMRANEPLFMRANEPLYMTNIRANEPLYMTNIRANEPLMSATEPLNMRANEPLYMRANEPVMRSKQSLLKQSTKSEHMIHQQNIKYINWEHLNCTPNGYTMCLNIGNYAGCCRSSIEELTRSNSKHCRAPSLKHYFVRNLPRPRSSILYKIATNCKQCCFLLVHMQHIFINSFGCFKQSVNFIVHKNIETAKCPSHSILRDRSLFIP